MYTNEHSRVNNCKLKATAICQERTKSEWLYQTRTFIWFETSIGLGVESFYWLFMRRLFRLRQEWYATSIFTCLNWMLFLNWNLVLTCMTGIPSWQYIRRLLAVKKTKKSKLKKLNEKWGHRKCTNNWIHLHTLLLSVTIHPYWIGDIFHSFSLSLENRSFLCEMLQNWCFSPLVFDKYVVFCM